MKTLCLFVIFCLYFLQAFALTKDERKELEPKPLLDVDEFNKSYQVIQKAYVDEIKMNEFLFAALNGGLSGLDSHSMLLSGKQYEKLKENIGGKFCGIGVVISEDKNFIKVISALDDTPAQKAGLQSGDYITHVDGKSLFDLTTEEASLHLRGKKGSIANLVVLRKGEGKPLEIAIKRDEIESKSVKTELYSGGVFYIRISSFVESTTKDILQHIEKTHKEKINAVILDLRSNPGGLLEQALLVSDLFLNNKKIVFVKNKIQDAVDEKVENKPTEFDVGLDKKRMIFYSNDGNMPWFESGTSPIFEDKIPLVVLINEGSASAAEIVAAAIKDNKRGILIGAKSFGKGSVQTIFPIDPKDLSKGSIKLTTARYYTPSKVSIQAKGIEPDILIENAELKKVTQTEAEKLLLQKEEDLKNHILSEQIEKAKVDSESYKKEHLDGIEMNFYEDYIKTQGYIVAKTLLKEKK